MERIKPNILITTAAFVLIVAGLRVASPIIIPLLLATFIAVVAAPLQFWLRSKGVPTILALLIIITMVLLIVFIVIALISSSLGNLSSNLPLYQKQLKEKVDVVHIWVETFGFNIETDQFYEAFNPNNAMKLVTKMLAGLSGVMKNSFLILITVIFILLEAAGFPAKIRAIVADPSQSLPFFDKFIHNIQRYMALKTIISIGTGILVSIFLAMLGVDFALLWGLVAFLMNYIPNIGSILAAIPAVILAFIQFGGGTALITIGGYAAINITIGNFLEPRIMGKGLGLSTLVVFLSLIFWGWVFGPVGMLLSVPLTMTLKIALDSNDNTRWIALLLGSSAEGSAASDIQIDTRNE